MDDQYPIIGGKPLIQQWINFNKLASLQTITHQKNIIQCTKLILSLVFRKI
jgi:hypothetical protein